MNAFLYVLVVLIWGTTWIALRWQLGPVSIALSIAYRFGLAALVLFAWLAWRRQLVLVGRLGPERAAYSTVLFPVVALNVSAWVEGCQWTAPALAGLALVMAGNVLVFRKPGGASRTAPSPRPPARA